MKPTTLCFPINKSGLILLGRKKRGFGADKYNGFGGKLEVDETFKNCAVRETLEEVSLLIKAQDLQVVGLLDFRFPAKPELTHIGYIYTVSEYKGVPLESEEMDPQWFSVEEVPYDQMWQGDKVWLPLILAGKKIKGSITFAEDNEKVDFMNISEVEDILESEDLNEIDAWLNE